MMTCCAGALEYLLKMGPDAKTRGGRDAVRTRAGLLDAARWLLTRRGYDQLGVREIAARAGVDAALVQRYFGSKKRLFEEAIAGHFDAMPLLAEQPREKLAARLTAILLQPTKDRERFDATLVMLRSAPSVEVRKLLVLALEREFLGPLAEAIGHGAESRARAISVLAVLAGFDLVHSVLGIDVLGDAHGQRLLQRLLEVCLDE
jgi:AcrR family transcriptional regulator